MKVTAANGTAIFEHEGDRFSVTFHRTIRLPEDGKTHALPPSMGLFPIKLVDDYKGKVPPSWEKHGGVFIPLHQREALWLGFHGSLPCAVKVAAGKINAVSGKPWSKRLSKGTEDYMVSPPQPWLDGFNAGKGVIKQFVAMPMGMGYTAEGQITGKEKHGGIQLLVVPAKKGRIARTISNTRGLLGGGVGHAGSVACSLGQEQALSARSVLRSGVLRSAGSALPKAAEMGLAGGGSMIQKIYPDPHGLSVWDQAAAGRLFVHIVNAEMYEAITGERPPASPVEAQNYGGPYYEISDGSMGDVKAPAALKKLKTVSQVDKKHGFKGQQNDAKLKEKTAKISGHLTTTQGGIRNGSW